MGHANATQVQLTDHAVGHRVEVGIQHTRLYAGQRRADGQGSRAQAIGIGGVLAQRTDRGFGRPVVVEHTQLWSKPANLVEQRPGRRFAAQDQGVPRQHMQRIAGIEQGLQMTGGDLQHVAALLALPLGEGIGVEGLLFVGQVQHTALAQGEKQHRVAEVGGHRRDHGEAALRGQLQALADACDIGGQVATGGDDGLGRATGAGGIDQVRRQFGHRPRPRQRRWRRRRVQVQIEGQPRKARHLGIGAQHQTDPAVGQYRRLPFCRPARIDRHIGSTTLEHREDTDDHGRRARAQQRHPCAGPDALGEQALAQGVGCAFDLCTAETHAGAGQGDGIRVEPVLVLPQAHYVLGLDRRSALVALVLNGQFEQPPFGLMAHRFGQ